MEIERINESFVFIIDETQRELQSFDNEKVKDSCRTRTLQDLDLSIVVPALHSIVFKKMTF